MLTFIHAPQTRSWRIAAVIDEIGIADNVVVRVVDLIRLDGSGRSDPANPHPEGKVPALIHDGTTITESGAIMLYLTALFPESGLAPMPGTAKRGEYLTWQFWYGSVMEPVLMLDAWGLQHPGIARNFRGAAEIAARLRAALEKGPDLLGADHSAADLLCHSPHAWLPKQLPEDALIRDWVARCQARPAVARVKAADAAMLQAA